MKLARQAAALFLLRIHQILQQQLARKLLFIELDAQPGIRHNFGQLCANRTQEYLVFFSHRVRRLHKQIHHAKALIECGQRHADMLGGSHSTIEAKTGAGVEAGRKFSLHEALLAIALGRVGGVQQR